MIPVRSLCLLAALSFSGCATYPGGEADGTCTCSAGWAKNPATGRCL